MQEFQLIAIFLFVLFLLLGSGVWVGLALMGVAFVGMELFTSRPAGDTMLTTIWTASSSWTLTALPLFIWMGEILYRTRLSEDMFRGLSPWMARLPGGLVHTNIVGCTVFAAVSGSSAATLTTVGKMSIPELRARNYPENMIIGTLAGAATLGLMIPPSLTLIVYGVTINESISKLFIAGIFPGLVLAAMFMGYVAIYSMVSKNWKPKPEPAMTFAEKVRNSRFLIPVIALISVVIGSMYLGFATATEAAAFGVLGSLTLAASQGSLSWSTFTASLMGATRTSAMIALILAGAAFLSLSMGFTGLPRALAELIATWELSRFELLMVLLVFVVIEMAQITPPIGFNLFVLQGMTKHEMNYIAKAAIPMFMIMVVMVFVLIAFPDLATWLPENMRQRPNP
jgi:tripartite ATP-independent transporter DctM subunit